MRWLESAAAAFAFLLAAQPSVQAFDCAGASTSIETAICAGRDLKRQDDALEAAYRDARAAMSAAERKMLALSQKRWIDQREQQCDGEAADVLTRCINGQTAERLSFLTGKPVSGPGYGAAMVPIVIQQEGTTKRMEYDYALIRFARPKTKAETLLNGEMAKITSEVTLGEDLEEEGEHIYSSVIAATLTYASPALISITLDLYDFEGGAHGNSGRNALNIDMASGEYVKASDIFPAAAQADLAAQCTEQILKEKRARVNDPGYDPKKDSLFAEKAVQESVADFGRWAIYADKAVVVFDAYEVGSYAEGPYECEFPMPALKALAANPNPLP